MSSLRKLLLPAALTLILAACGKEEAPAPGATPEATVAAAPATSPVAAAQSAAKALQNNDIVGMLKASMPAATYNEIKTKFESEMSTKEITDEDRAQFTEGLNQIAGPDSVENIMAMAEPQLEAMKPQMAMMIPLVLAQAQQGLASNAELSESQKQQATAVINSMSGWATKTDFADANKLRSALTDISNAVKATGITSPDDIKALKFEDALGKAGILLGGLKKALKNYDLDIDAMLASQKVELVSETGDTAKIKTSMTLFDSPIEVESEMVKIDGNWYAKDSADAIKKMLEQ